MKLNKVLLDINVSISTKKYVNNYINESIKLMLERGYVEEFIWVHGISPDKKYDDEIIELVNKSIITYGTENSENILIPVSEYWTGEHKDDVYFLKYMISDNVLLQNGFKNLKCKEEV